MIVCQKYLYSVKPVKMDTCQNFLFSMTPVRTRACLNKFGTLWLRSENIVSGKHCRVSHVWQGCLSRGKRVPRICYSVIRVKEILKERYTCHFKIWTVGKICIWRHFTTNFLVRETCQYGPVSQVNAYSLTPVNFACVKKFRSAWLVRFGHVWDENWYT